MIFFSVRKQWWQFFLGKVEYEGRRRNTGRQRSIAVLALGLLVLIALPSIGFAKSYSRDVLKHIVDGVAHPLMAKDEIPGMAIGVLVDGKPLVFNYGYASLATKLPVTNDTLFELGSISKTFTVTLAALAQVRHKLSFMDHVGTDWPTLKGYPFGRVTLLSLATHTPGGLPMQVPQGIRDASQLLNYFKTWHPSYPLGTYRTYSNISIGFLGEIAARRMGAKFTTLIRKNLFSVLGMHETYLQVPENRMSQYAQGYTDNGKPIRMVDAVLGPEAYGVRSTASDMLRFLGANMGLLHINPQLRKAIALTHIAYYKAGPMFQDLIWEQYPYPVALKSLLQGNGPAMILHPQPVIAVQPPERSDGNVWINKTGSTNGFSAYAAFVPALRLGVVILANRRYPLQDRVTAGYDILVALSDQKIARNGNSNEGIKGNN